MHPSTQQVLRYFTFAHMPDGLPRRISAAFCGFAEDLVREVPEGPELTVALRKLLEAKDCAVRASLP